MQILLVCPVAAVAAVAAVQTPSVSQGLARSPSVMVRAVIDSHTMDVATIGRVRLLGIEVPRSFEGEARRRLMSLVLKRWVHLQQEEGPGDGASSRHLAYVVRDDGLFVNAALVREGLARVAPRAPVVRLDELKRAEVETQRSRRGMWGTTPPSPSTGYTRDSNKKP